jgi:hypothetical protein
MRTVWVIAALALLFEFAHAHADMNAPPPDRGAAMALPTYNMPVNLPPPEQQAQPGISSPLVPAIRVMSGTRFLGTSVAADLRPGQTYSVAKCLLVLGGAIIIDGPCNLWIHTDDGSFDMYVSHAYAMIDIEAKGRAKGWWNGGVSSYADRSLGDLIRDGACWENEWAKVCAWK